MKQHLDDDRQFDEALRQKLEGLELPFQADDWLAMEHELDTHAVESITLDSDSDFDNIFRQKLEGVAFAPELNDWSAMESALNTELPKPTQQVDTSFDALIRRKLKGLEVPFRATDWLAMESELNARAPQPLIILLNNRLAKFMVAALLMLVSLYGVKTVVNYSFYHHPSIATETSPSKKTIEVADLPLVNPELVDAKTNPNALPLQQNNHNHSNETIAAQTTKIHTAKYKQIEEDAYVMATNQKVVVNELISLSNSSNTPLVTPVQQQAQILTPSLNVANIPKKEEVVLTPSNGFNQGGRTPIVEEVYPMIPENSSPEQSVLLTKSELNMPQAPSITEPSKPYSEQDELLWANASEDIGAILAAQLLNDIEEEVNVPEETEEQIAVTTLVNKLEQLETEDIPVPSSVKKRKFYVGVHSSTDANFANFNIGQANAGYTGGVSAAWRANEHLALETGVYYTKKEYHADNQPITALNLSAENFSTRRFEESAMKAEMGMLEVPVLAKYHLLPNAKVNPYVATGVSAYIPIQEKRTYNNNISATLVDQNATRAALVDDLPIGPSNASYYTPNYNNFDEYEVAIKSSYIADETQKSPQKAYWDIANVRVGANVRLNKRLHLQVESQFKTSISKHSVDTASDNLLAESKRLSSLGVQLGITYEM